MDDDRQRQPRDSDRGPVAARINQAHDEGRIGLADRDIRLRNVQSAQSLAELELMIRELDQLDAAIPPSTSADAAGAADAKPYAKFEPGSGEVDDVDEDAGPEPDKSPVRTLGVIASVVVAIVLAVAVVVFVSYRGGRSDGDGAAVDPVGPSTPVTEAPVSSDAEKVKPVAPVPAGTAYSLSANGIRSFLQTYRKRFGTSRVVDLTLYGQYVVVNVPVPGRARQEGWLYRDGAWTSFGGVRAVFPGSQVVDTNRLAVAPLIRNIERARASLHVEKPAQVYVIVRFIRGADPVPSVDVHVTSKFNESAYLATTLDGKVERAFPYAS